MHRRLRRRSTVLIVAIAALMLLAAPASAHVTVRTDNPSAGGFAVYTVRVPNESEAASTMMVEVQMPEGLEASRYQPKPGWTITLQEGVLTAESGGSGIAPGEFDEFSFQARNPDQPTSLAFPAIQTYDDGEAVEWIGAPDSDTPAAVVEIVAGNGGAGEGHGHAATADPAAGASTEEPSGGVDPAGPDGELTSATTSPGDTGGDQLATIALVLGAVGAVAGGAALWRSLRA